MVGAPTFEDKLLPRLDKGAIQARQGKGFFVWVVVELFRKCWMGFLDLPQQPGVQTNGLLGVELGVLVAGERQGQGHDIGFVRPAGKNINGFGFSRSAGFGFGFWGSRSGAGHSGRWEMDGWILASLKVSVPDLKR